MKEMTLGKAMPMKFLAKLNDTTRVPQEHLPGKKNMIGTKAPIKIKQLLVPRKPMETKLNTVIFYFLMHVSKRTKVNHKLRYCEVLVKKVLQNFGGKKTRNFSKKEKGKEKVLQTYASFAVHSNLSDML